MRFGIFIVSFIFFMLISTFLCTATEVINLGGLRKVLVKLEQNNENWTVQVRMIPVRCFTPVTNRKVTKSYAQRYAMTALAVHFKEKYLSAKSCSMLSESHTEFYSTILFQISGIVLNKQTPTENDIMKMNSNKNEVSSLSDNLLNQFNDWLNTLNCYFNILELELSSLQKTKKQMKPDEFCIKIAEFEDNCNANCKSFNAKIRKDSLLLSTEQKELLSILDKKQNEIRIRLKGICCFSNSLDGLFSEIQMEDIYKPYLFADISLMENGGAQLYKISFSKYLLIAVGFTDVNSDTVEDRIRQKKAARINAMTHLLKKTGVKLMTKAIITEEYSIVKDTYGKEKIVHLEKVFDTTQEKVQGKVLSLPVIGTWYSKDKDIFYTAIGEFFNYE